MLSHRKRLFIFHGYFKVLNTILDGEEVSYFLYDNHSYLLEFSIKKVLDEKLQYLTIVIVYIIIIIN